MLILLSTTLRQLFVKASPADDPPREISFAQPTREASARWSRPAINLYLYDVRENARLRNHAPAWEKRQTSKGEPAERRKAVRLDAHYLLTVWGNSHEDEEFLLDSALMALFRSTNWDVATLAPLFDGDAKAITPELLTPADWEDIYGEGNVPPEIMERATSARITLQVAQSDDLQKPTDLWSVLSNDLRPAIPITVTFALQPFDTIAIRPVREAYFRSQQTHNDATHTLFSVQLSGRLTIRRDGLPISRADLPDLRVRLVERDEVVPVDDAGTYRLRDLKPGKYSVEITADAFPSPQRKPLTVPADSYDIEIDVPRAPAIGDGAKRKRS